MNHRVAIRAYDGEIIGLDNVSGKRCTRQRNLVMDVCIVFTDITVKSKKVETAASNFAEDPTVNRLILVQLYSS